MALDGLFLHKLKNEIASKALGARVDKIFMPSREEIVLSLHHKDGDSKLLLSATAGSPRAHFTKAVFENPKVPPMFCMLLRKLLNAARLVSIRQPDLERILMLDFDAPGELRDGMRITIIIEIMGRHSNIIISDISGRVIDAVKRISLDTSSVRQILPGILYEPPPAQGKLCLLKTRPRGILEAALPHGHDEELAKLLLKSLQGMSPIMCREAAYFATGDPSVSAAALTDTQRQRLAEYLEALKLMLQTDGGIPTVLTHPDGRPFDVACCPINQYGNAALSTTLGGYSETLDHFYSKRDDAERIRQHAKNLTRFLSGAIERVSRRLAAQNEDLRTCGARDRLKIFGDLIYANIYSITKGQRSVTLENFYSDDISTIDIPLNSMLSPAQNAQKFYDEYRKAANAEKVLKKLIAQGEVELVYLESLSDLLSRASGLQDLDSIRQELAETGLLKQKNGGARKKPEKPAPPVKYRSTDGFIILAGRNNLQNDMLSMKSSSKQDMWFHAQKLPGSHVVVAAEGKDIPDSTIEQAAVIAAWNSKARALSTAAVDYTPVKNLKKPGGAKPGMVVYEAYKTAFVSPDEALVNSLLVKR